MNGTTATVQSLCPDDFHRCHGVAFPVDGNAITVHSIALGIHVEDILGLESFDSGAEFDKRWKEITESPSDETITVIHTKDPQTAITAALDQLNEEGQQKAVERVTELTEIKRYKK